MIHAGGFFLLLHPLKPSQYIPLRQPLSLSLNHLSPFAPCREPSTLQLCRRPVRPIAMKRGALRLVTRRTATDLDSDRLVIPHPSPWRPRSPAVPGFVTTMAPLTPAGPVCCPAGLIASCTRTSGRSFSDHPPLLRSRGLFSGDRRSAGDVARNGQIRCTDMLASLGFATGAAAHRRRYAVSSRHPTDPSFTSWCSPPPLPRTQFRSVTAARPATDGTPTLLIQYTRNRTAPRREPGDCGPLGLPAPASPINSAPPQPLSGNQPAPGLHPTSAAVRAPLGIQRQR